MTAKVHALYVEVTASSEQLITEMIEQLARMACDIANNTDDADATITIWDDDRAENSHLSIQTGV